MTEGPLRDGVHQKSIHLLRQHLSSEYKHVDLSANFKRIVSMLKNGNPCIMVGLFRTEERLKKGILYSEIPLHLLMPNRLIIRKEDRSRLAQWIKGDAIDLKMFVRSQKFKIGIHSGRAYSGIIDHILTNNKTNQSISNAKNFSSLFAMLNAGRVDAIVNFPDELVYNARQLQIPVDRFLPLKIKGMELYTKPYIAFPGTDFGQKLKASVDSILRKPDVLSELLVYYAEWIPDKAAQKEYHELVQSYYKKNHGIEVGVSRLWETKN